jgi:hypothetical protein
MVDFRVGLEGLEEFEQEVAAFEAEMQAELKAGSDAMARDTFTRIVERTPHRSGSAKLSWRMKRNGVDPTVTELGPFQAMGAEAAGQLALLQLAELGNYDPMRDDLVISNSLGYADDLESGSSDQAPRGMVAVTVAEVEAFGDRYFQREGE